MRDPMSFDDYHNSRWIAWPFHLLDCCLVTDAGAAVVITKADRARDLPKKPVWVLGAAEHHEHCADQPDAGPHGAPGRRTPAARLRDGRPQAHTTST